MPEQNDLNRDQQDLETALRSVSAAPARIDPVTAAFDAGKRSAWRRAGLFHSSLAAAIIAGMLFWKSSASHDAPLAHAPAAKLIASMAAPSDQSMVMLRRAILESGVDGLPAASVPEGRAVRANDVF